MPQVFHTQQGILQIRVSTDGVDLMWNTEGKAAWILCGT